MRVFFNPYNLQEVWVTSFGNGIKIGNDPSIVVLPLELLAFEGQNTEGGNILTWQTANEINISNFDIERSADGHFFEKIGEIKTKGANGAYAFTDAKTALNLDKTSARFVTSTPLDAFEIMYYRLKINDLDGSFSFSKIIALKRQNTEGPKMRLFPNPVSDILTVENVEGSALEVVNALGQIVIKTTPLSAQNKSFLLDVSHLPSGVYFVRTAREVLHFVKK